MADRVFRMSDRDAALAGATRSPGRRRPPRGTREAPGPGWPGGRGEAGRRDRHPRRYPRLDNRRRPRRCSRRWRRSRPPGRSRRRGCLPRSGRRRSRCRGRGRGPRRRSRDTSAGSPASAGAGTSCSGRCIGVKTSNGAAGGGAGLPTGTPVTTGTSSVPCRPLLPPASAPFPGANGAGEEPGAKRSARSGASRLPQDPGDADARGRRVSGGRRAERAVRRPPHGQGVRFRCRRPACHSTVASRCPRRASPAG